MKRDGGSELRKAWPTEQLQRLSRRALFAFVLAVVVLISVVSEHAVPRWIQMLDQISF